MVQDDAEVINWETMDNDWRYCGVVGTYGPERQPLNSGLCYKERVVGVPRKRRGRNGFRKGMDQRVILNQTRTMKFKCV